MIKQAKYRPHGPKETILYPVPSQFSVKTDLFQDIHVPR